MIMTPVTGYEGCYSINESGDVFSHYVGRNLSPHRNNEGYWIVDLYKAGVRRKYLVHRLLGMAFMDLKEDEWLDHADGNRTNNLLSNLRKCDASQNTWNGAIYKNNKSGYRGVSFSKRVGRWQVFINTYKKVKWLGYFTKLEDAANAYAKADLEMHGEFASVNRHQFAQ